MKNIVKAAVKQQTAAKLAQKAAEMVSQKAITPKVEKIVKTEVKKAEKEAPKTFLQKVASTAGHAWRWFKEGGWETLLTVGSLLSLMDENNDHKWTKHLAGRTGISSGTILAKIPISAAMFDDVNDRLQRQLSLYTYYSFLNSSIHFKGAQGDLVNGQIGMFCVPDPDLVIASNDSAAVVRLIREYGGRIFKLSEKGHVMIPNANTTLNVQPGMTDERRTHTQAVLYIVAVTDLDFDGPLGEFSIKYDVEMSKNANTGLVSLASPASFVSIFTRVNYPDQLLTETCQIDSYNEQYSKQYTTFVRTTELEQNYGNYFQDVNGYAQFKPGIYNIKLFAKAAFDTSYIFTSGDAIEYDPYGTLVCSDTPTWTAENDPTNSNTSRVYAAVVYCSYSATNATINDLASGDLIQFRTKPFYIGYSAGIQVGTGNLAGANYHYNLQSVSVSVTCLQVFPIEDFDYAAAEGDRANVGYGPANNPGVEYQRRMKAIEGQKYRKDKIKESSSSITRSERRGSSAQ